MKYLVVWKSYVFINVYRRDMMITNVLFQKTLTKYPSYIYLIALIKIFFLWHSCPLSLNMILLQWNWKTAGAFTPCNENILCCLTPWFCFWGFWHTLHSKWNEKKALPVQNNVLQARTAQNGFNLELWRTLAQGWVFPKIIVLSWVPFQ